MTELLAVASDDQLPFMAISAFAGVRHAEIQRLDWANVDKEAAIIEIRAGTAKTASRRGIPIQPNLAAWPEYQWEEAGPVCSFTNMVDQFKDMTRKVNQARRAAWAETAAEEGWAPFAWKHNVLRHSFISYRVAEVQNVVQVALEAGNSPQMIFQHYRELVRQ